jgi:hypothetical protein
MRRKKPGPRPKPASERRTHLVRSLVTPAEWKAIKHAADEASLGLSDWARAILAPAGRMGWTDWDLEVIGELLAGPERDTVAEAMAKAARRLAARTTPAKKRKGG